MAARPRQMRRLLTGGLVAALGVLGTADNALAVPTFNVTQLGISKGPLAVAAAPPACLGGPPSCPGGGLPHVADFNGDGLTDLAVADATGNAISIFLGTGNPASPFPITPSRNLVGTATAPLSTPKGIALGDFNADGVTDIVVTSSGNSSALVFIGNKNAITGNGDGTFKSPIKLTTLANPLGIAVGRFRGAGQNLDIAVVDATTVANGKVSIFLGNGDGTFQSKVDFTVGDHPRNIVVGDFGSVGNKTTPDGIQDIAITVAGSDDKVSILYSSGNPASLFSAPVKLAADAGPDGIALADLNNDGCQDIAIANNGVRTDGTVIEQASVLFGRCHGEVGDSFGGVGRAALLPSGSNPSGITAAQLDSDSRFDLAVTQMGGASSLQKVIMLFNRTTAGSGVPDFTSGGTLTCSADATPTGVAAGNFNGDTIDDLAVANNATGSNDVSVVLPNGGTTLCGTTLQVGNVPPAQTPWAVALCNVTDFSGVGPPDGAGVLDLLVLDRQLKQVVVFAGDGNGNFARSSATPSGVGTSASAIACDGTGFGITNQGDNDFRRYTNNNNGTFSFTTPASGLSAPTSLAFGDFNGDTANDWSIVNNSGNNIRISTDGTVSVDTAPVSIATGIFNTTRIDLPVAASLNAVDVLLNNKDGIAGQDGILWFKAPRGLGNSSGGVSNVPVWVTVGDINKDGHDDFATANKAQHNVTVITGLGGQNFNNPLSFNVLTSGTSSQPNSVVIGDFDLDGKRDVLVTDTARDKLVFMAGDGAGDLASCASGSTCDFPVGNAPASVVKGQLNADCALDAVLVDQSGSSIDILLNTTPPPACGCCGCPACCPN
jgi:hypothetical protein